MGALDDVREASEAPRGVRPGSSTVMTKIGQLLSVDAVTQRASVSIEGSQPISLPYLPSDYVGYTTVLVLCNPLEGGRALWVLGPVGAQTPTETPPAPAPPPATVTAEALILPTWSGTWSTTWGKWGAWTNAYRYGYPTSLYQGDKYGSGVLKGLAVYGDQIVNLSALSIESATVSLVVATTSETGVPTVQGAPYGTPAPAGPPVSSGATNGGTGWVPLDSSICEALRTGSAKSLAMVGAGYTAVFGEGRPDGMALKIRYTRAG